MTSPEQPYPAQEPEEPTFSAWLLIWTIIAAKVGTLLLILWAAHDFETGILLAATSWLWVPLIVAICASPVLFRIRLHRVRANREALKRAEWMVDSDIPSEVEDSELMRHNRWFTGLKWPRGRPV